MQQVDTLLASLEHILQVSYVSTYCCDLHTLQRTSSTVFNSVVTRSGNPCRQV